MEKKRCILGIDLGTSSVKILKKYEDGSIRKLKNTYKEPLPVGWWKSILELLEQIDWQEVEAIGLSSQVGTYVINDKDVIGWNQSIGKEELNWWKENYATERFVQEISMPHPDIISYPLPRLKYIKDHMADVDTICQPKEYILKCLTGEWVSDPYSWRGLANLEKKDYSEFFLQELGLKREQLPPIKRQDALAGYTKEIRFANNVLPEGIPVYVGLNDYFAGLLGMGVGKKGQMFDLTGTSEHIGVIQDNITEDTSLVCGPYLHNKVVSEETAPSGCKHHNVVHYGVTASSGPSIKYGLRLLETCMEAEKGKCEEIHEKQNEDENNHRKQDFSLDMESVSRKKPPIFLPYLKGERAPIWNADARGVFFGVEENADLEQMIYAVMEGVVFSLYHIYDTMGKPEIDSITVSGGAAEIDYLNELKSQMFGRKVQVVRESDVSALGACMVAAVGAGMYKDYEQVTEEWVQIEKTVEPMGDYKEWFDKRFRIYKQLYENVKPLYEEWKQL